MAEIIQQEQKTESAKGAKSKQKKFSTLIDMTPMVDLMCLLITFFMLTTAFSKPKVLEITMPLPGGDPLPLPAGRTINILLSDSDKIYWYNGIADPDKPPLPALVKSNYGKDGIRKMLLNRNKIVSKKIEALKTNVVKGNLVMSDSALNKEIIKIKKTADTRYPIVLIKADDKARYGNLVDIIDEMAICNIASYAVVPLSKTENSLLEKAKEK
jgi:biopolymer transport protein ExbD